MKKIVWGVLFVIGGVTCYLVLRETHSGMALASIGCFSIIWGVLERAAGLGPADPELSQTKPRETTPPPRLNASEAELWIARELGRLRMPDDLIAPVCEMTDLNWEEAKQLIRSVQDSETVGKRRAALSLSYPIIAIGACLLVATTFSLVYHIAVIHNAGMVHPPVYYGFFVGLLMTAGGLYGMRHVNS